MEDNDAAKTEIKKAGHGPRDSDRAPWTARARIAPVRHGDAPREGGSAARIGVDSGVGMLGGCLIALFLLIQALYRQLKVMFSSQWNKALHDIPSGLSSPCFIAGYGGLPDTKLFCQVALGHARV